MNFEKFRSWFENLAPDRQRNLAKGALVFLVLVICFAVYIQGEKKPQVNGQQGTARLSELQPRLGILEKSLYYETSTKVKAIEGKLDRFSLELKAINQKLEKDRKQRESQREKEIEALKREIETLKKSRQSLPAVNVSGPPRPGLGQRSGKEQQLIRIIGGVGRGEKISSVNPDTAKSAEKPANSKEKEEEQSVYLPPSYVPADLITGFDVMTLENGQREPIKVLLRLRDLAVLPNEVKGDLEGCFVIAEAYGNLADEKAHLRLLRLSCVARDGHSVIDEKVKGFVVDGENGSVALRGPVVTKAGALVGRSFLAKFFQGFGEAYESGAYDLNTIASGQVRTLKPNKAIRAGVGKGISGSAESLSKFFMKMASQVVPIIEVGTGRRVFVVFEEGVELHIKKRCIGGRNGCKQQDHGSWIYSLRNI